MADPKKYRVKIVKIGVGDPVIGLAFRFENAEGYNVPSTGTPIHNLNIQSVVSDSNINDWTNSNSMNVVSNTDQFTMVMPFEEEAYQDGQDMTVVIYFYSDFEGSEWALYDFDAPDPGQIPGGWTFESNGNQSFTVHLTGGFNTVGLKQALIDAGWIPESEGPEAKKKGVRR